MRGCARDTPARLVAAGLKLFSEHGLDGVTTRALAAEAGVNQAAIPYYFGSKEGVHLCGGGSGQRQSGAAHRRPAGD